MDRTPSISLSPLFPSPCLSFSDHLSTLVYNPLIFFVHFISVGLLATCMHGLERGEMRERQKERRGAPGKNTTSVTRLTPYYPLCFLCSFRLPLWRTTTWPGYFPLCCDCVSVSSSTCLPDTVLCLLLSH